MVLRVEFSTLGAKRAARIRKQNKAIRQAEEERLQTITKRVAREILGEKKIVTLQKGSEITKDYSINNLILGYKGSLDTNNSNWAPWNLKK